MTETPVLAEFGGWARSLGESERRVVVAVLLDQAKATSHRAMVETFEMCAAVLLEAERSAAAALAALDPGSDPEGVGD